MQRCLPLPYAAENYTTTSESYEYVPLHILLDTCNCSTRPRQPLPVRSPCFDLYTFQVALHKFSINSDLFNVEMKQKITVRALFGTKSLTALRTPKSMETNTLPAHRCRYSMTHSRAVSLWIRTFFNSFLNTSLLRLLFEYMQYSLFLDFHRVSKFPVTRIVSFPIQVPFSRAVSINDGPL